MCKANRLLVATGWLVLVGPRVLAADPGYVQAAEPYPQAIPAATDPTLTIDIHDLSSPGTLEPLLLRALRESTAPGFALAVPGGLARLGNYSLGSGESHQGDILVLNGNADLYGRLSGNLVAVEGNITVHPGAYVSGSLLAYGGEVHQAGGQVTGDIQTLDGAGGANTPAPAATSGSVLVQALRNVAGLAGIFITLLGIGFGLVLFGRPHLEIISDTIVHTFGRSFAVGVLAQVLVLPTFGVLVLGLVLSVVGILLVPFAVIASVLVALVAVLAGFLGVAHVLGERYTRRQLAQGRLGSPSSYRYVLTGLVGMILLWTGWAAFGWVPVLGWIAFGAAAVATWFLMTVGLGAALLSRFGLAGHFAGRLIPPEALTDEYLWATPQFGVPAARRPGQHKTPPPVR
ncbi:MAG TPA: hypothetical protein VFV65_04370 [Gemmatimonadales bacterium]|nr:hypothetical protein [Gemmatimonadales bacterium]